VAEEAGAIPRLSPEVLRARKAEVSEAETRRQCEAF
jgi:hypothetical protein